MQIGGWTLGLAAGLILIGAVLFFGLGYYAAVLTAGVDPTTAVQAATAFGRSSPDVYDALNDARFAVRRTAQSPAYGVQRVAGEGTARLTADMPDFLRTNPQVMGLLESSDNSQTAMVSNYESALARFENKALRDAGAAIDGMGAEQGRGAAEGAGAEDAAAGQDGASEGKAVAVDRRRVATDAGVPGLAYALELGSFLSAERAESFAAALIAEGHAAAIAEQVDGAGRTWLHVRLGPYPTYAAAARVHQRLKAQGLSGDVVEEIAEEQQSNAGALHAPTEGLRGAA